MRKIAFITNRLPFPGTDGRKKILLQYIRQIKEIDPDAEIVNLSFVDDDRYLKDRPDEIDRLVCLKLPGLVEKLFNMAVYSLLLRKWPLQVSAYYSRKTHRKIAETLRAERPDLIVYDMVRVAEYWTEGPGRKVLSYDDLLSLRYKRQLQWARYIPSVFGGFADKLPGALRPFADLKFVQKMLLALESRLLDRYEKTAAPRFDHLVFTSPVEAAHFRELTRHPSCHGIPMKFDAIGRTGEGARAYNANKIVFVGKMDIPHNSSAVVYFCERIWPRIKRQAPDATFYIVGKSPTAEVLRLQEAYPGIVVTGEVDNVRRLVEDAALLIAPLLFGTGIKTKILEAMSWGVPVVTNPVGSEGIDAKQGEELFVCESDEEIVRAVLLLLSDRAVNEKLSRNSVGYVKRRFGSEAIRRKMERILT
mgnify:CR=1 FL=1|jgi:glycosyltransferase involved in cell wall biosynthesis